MPPYKAPNNGRLIYRAYNGRFRKATLQDIGIPSSMIQQGWLSVLHAVMEEEDHIKLLDVLDRHPGPAFLSGYSCPLYEERLSHWTKRTARALAEGGREREEVLWLNPIATEKMSMSLFWNQISEVKLDPQG
jgi:DNA adenine methylase